MTNESTGDDKQPLEPSASPEPASTTAATTDETAPIAVTISSNQNLTAPGNEKACLKSPTKSERSLVPVPATTAKKELVAPASKKQHLEQRLRRHVMWGAMNLAVVCGRVLSKFGAKNAAHLALRKTARLGGGLKRAVLPGITHSKVRIAGVKCRVYSPIEENSTPKPVLIYLHGGGWVICSARSYHPFALGLARDTGAIVVTVDYRLAPENPYPASLEDCLAVTKSLLENENEALPEELKGKIDPSRVVLGGDSAGGNLAACVALDLIRAGDERLHAIMLVCPVLQAVTQDFESFRKFGRHSNVGISWFLSQYAGVVAPRRKLLRLIDQGRHVSDETSQKLVSKYLTISSASSNEGQNAPDSGCQTASSSLPSPNSNPVVVAEVIRSATSPVPGNDNPALEDDKKTENATATTTAGPLVVTAAAVTTTGDETHVETDQLIEKGSDVPEAVTELATTVRAWPLLAEDAELAKMPITMVQVCAEDPLLEEGRIFAERLKAAGARDVRYFHLPRAQHAEPVLRNMLHSKAAKRGYAEIVSFFKDVTGLDAEHKEPTGHLDAEPTTPAPLQPVIESIDGTNQAEPITA